MRENRGSPHRRFPSPIEALSMSDHGTNTPDAPIKGMEQGQRPCWGLKLKSHVKRFWWLHLIIFICSTLIIVLCLIYVAFPRIAQNGINDSTLEIQSLVIAEPTPESFRLQQIAIIKNHDTYHPRLDAFNASLSIDRPEHKPYAYIELPAVHATTTATTFVNQTVEITDIDALTDYTKLALSNEEVKVAVRGRTALHEMRFPTTTVDYHKVVTMKGLNKLTGFNVTSFEIKLVAEPDGTNMIGTVYIPNPSVMTISMGNVTFNNYVRGDLIGTSLLTNLVLVPGNNTVPMRSAVNQTLVISKIVDEFRDGLLSIDIVCNSSVYEGRNLRYFEEALRANPQHITLDVGGKLREIGVEIGDA